MSTLLCGATLCGPATMECGPNATCVCLVNFFGSSCQSNFLSARPDLFYAYLSVSLALFAALSLFGIWLVRFYVRVFLPAVPGNAVQAQGVAMALATLGCVSRCVWCIAMLSFGPFVEFSFFTAPSFTQWFLRASFGQYYWMTIGAFSINVVVWIDLLRRVKAMRIGQTNTWMWRAVLVLCATFFVCELVVEVLLVVLWGRVQQRAVLAVRILLAVGFAGLLALTLFFGLRFVSVLRASAEADRRRHETKRRVTKLILATCAALVVAFIMVMVVSFVRLPSPGAYFGQTWSLRAVEVVASVVILSTGLSIMRDRMRVAKRRAKEHLEAVTGSLETPLLQQQRQSLYKLAPLDSSSAATTSTTDSLAAPDVAAAAAAAAGAAVGAEPSPDSRPPSAISFPDIVDDTSESDAHGDDDGEEQ